ncbi:hypothetical protein EIK79_02195 [Halocatena pleomorpha]|uniref:Uncharacterized protein n=1 Tax=Halocatena pleomorpha TaxID=1785090 RepID=A0A3P3RL86_9EURY|nr:hypothetical protein EIK79_02195 [Halocatena pleomorpha]
MSQQTQQMRAEGTTDTWFSLVDGTGRPVSGLNWLGGPTGDGVYPQQDNGDGDKYTIDIGVVDIDIGEIIRKAFKFIVSLTMELISSAIDTFNDYILGVPAPGDPTEVSTWISAENPWPAVYGVYGIMTTVAIALLTPSFMVAIDTVDPHQRRTRLTELGKAAFFIILGVPAVAFCLHLGNEFTQAIAPGGYEFISSTSGVADLSLGLLFGALLIWAKGTVVGIGLIISIMIYMSIYILVAFWPLFWALRVQPQSDLQSYGIVGISMLPLIILLRFTQSGILRLLHQLPYDSLGGIAVKVIAIVAGLSIALIWLPYIFVTKLFPRSIILTQNRSSSGTHHPTSQPRGSGSSGGQRGQNQNRSYGSGGYGATSKSPDSQSSFSVGNSGSVFGISTGSPGGNNSKRRSSNRRSRDRSEDDDDDDSNKEPKKKFGASSESPNR